MSAKNVEVVRDQFDAVNERDFPRAMSHYAEDVVLVAHTGGLPRPVGHSRVATRWGMVRRLVLLRSHTATRFEIYEARDLGDRVLIAADHHARGRNSGVEVQRRRWLGVHRA